MKSGPLRKVTRQKKNGLHGKSRWNIEMECGHVDRASRKSPRDQRRCAAVLEGADGRDEFRACGLLAHRSEANQRS